MQGHEQHHDYRGLRYAKEHIGRKIQRLCPNCFVYVEPFAGHAWVWKQIADKGFKCILGDRQCKVISWIREHHGKQFQVNPPKFLCQDWAKTVKKYDSKKTIFVIDPPWEHEADESCAANKERIDWNCDFDINNVIEKSKHLKGAVIFALHPKQKDLLCKPPFRCETFSKIVGNARFQYLLTSKKPS